MKQTRILHCNNDNKNMGGAYLVERKLEPYIRQYGYIFDYMTMDEFVLNRNEQTDPLGDSKTFSARLRGNRILGHIQLPFYVKKILKENPYKVVHIDIDSAWKAILYAVPAQKSGAKVLVHSHANGIDGSYKGLKSALHKVCKNILSRYTDKYIGCSQGALEWLCPKNRLSQSAVITNGIDNKEYFYSEELRKNTRKELGLNEEFVLCNVGRINDNKNQIFLIDVLKALREKISDAVLLLVGPYAEEGYGKIMQKVKAEKLDNYVIITGETNQVNKYLNAADFFVLPSIFEGLSLASIEAQRTGLKCLLSTGNPPEASVTEMVIREPLDRGSKAWAELIVNEAYKNGVRSSMILNMENTMEGMAKTLSGVYSALIGG